MEGNNIVLTGFMGVGKGAVARELGRMLGRPVIDTDDLAARLAGHPPDHIIADQGEDVFRRWERRAVAMASGVRGAVIATGGGVVLDPANVRRLERDGTLIRLSATIEDILDRTGAGTHRASNRPLLAAVDRDSARRLISDMLARREPSYLRARFTVDTTGLDPSQVAKKIARLLKVGADTERRSAARSASSPANPGYPVLLGRGILGEPRILARVLEAGHGQRGMLVSDPLVGGMYGGRVAAAARQLGLDLIEFTVPPGERAKKLNIVEGMYRALLSAGIGRDGFILALGGGAVGDVAGFAAATYMRGIKYIQIPTTLVAQVDSALGGKTAVNLPGHKNAVGAFHRPGGIVADLDVLGTLPPVEIRSGLGEILKYGAIVDQELWALTLEWAGTMGDRVPPGADGTARYAGETVGRCLAHKARVVDDDELETGVREILNFGHTLGHALEAAARGRLRHGHAVVVGMDFATYLGERLGFTEPGTHRSMRSDLRAVGLCSGPPARACAGQLLSLIMVDKKMRAGKPRFVFVERLGRALPRAQHVEPDRVEAALEGWLRGDIAGCEEEKR